LRQFKKGDHRVLLALETSSLRGSVVAWEDGKIIASRDLSPDQRSAQSLIPAIDGLMKELGRSPQTIRQIAVTDGPGSFTGLRVGVTAAKTLAYALGAKTLGVDTLDVIARQAIEGLAPQNAPTRIHAVLDAFRGQLFCRVYPAADHLPHSHEPATIVSIDDFLHNLKPGDFVSGPVLTKLVGSIPETVKVVDKTLWNPHAKTVALLASDAFALGHEIDFWRLVPRYVRQAAAEERAAEG
jgi:tRNA threonylcarbamoyladenosine biosynthesis protein TsaB